MAGQRRTSDVDVNTADFDKALQQALDDLHLQTLGGLLALANGTINRAKELCPVDTGALRSSLGFEQGKDSRGEYVDLYARRNYAAFVEFGTVKQPAQPFLRPALAEAARTFGTGSFYKPRTLRAA